METVIDWSKAPDWAVAYAQVIYEHETAAKDFAWVCAEGYNVNPFGKTEQVCHPYMKQFFTADRFHLIEFRPSKAQAWPAEGLPPVGTVCEMRRTDYVDVDWQRIEFLCAGSKRAFFRDLEGHEWSRPLGYLKFRPIRTPEQIAADERDAAIKEMEKDADYVDRGSFSKLYAAGWRKPVTP